ncbi:MAG TPA: tRNA-dihydrouridine synthase [Solirubrobacteraceae bacterium]|jgi:nifR3 family TIM-barrel protein
MAPLLTDEWTLGSLRVPNRVMLAPLAGIGNWFVRLQAKRYGAGMAVSEMVSSHAIHHRNARTCEELLRIDPREREAGASGAGGIVSIQLFGADARVMRSAAARAAEAGADAIDLNMGCPVPKVCKTGAGAALLDDHERALAVARAAIQGSGLPVTVKLRSGQRPGERSGIDLARRLVEDAGVAAIALHPRSAAVRHSGSPDYELAGELAGRLGAPLILSGGLRDRDGILAAFATSGASAVMLARGALGNPWLFTQLLGGNGEPGSAEPDAAEPSVDEVKAELRWMVARACEHLGRERATRWMRKAYPWYIARLRLPKPAAKALQESLQRAATLAEADELLERATTSSGNASGDDAHCIGGESPRYTPALATA